MTADLKRSYRSIYRQKSLHSLSDIAHRRNVGFGEAAHSDIAHGRNMGFGEAAQTAGTIAVGNTALKGHRDRHHRN